VSSNCDHIVQAQLLALWRWQTWKLCG